MADSKPPQNDNPPPKVISLSAHAEKLARKMNELTPVVCPVCNTIGAGFIPVTGFSPHDKRPLLVALLCNSKECDGLTVIDADNGFLDPARICTDDDDLPPAA